MQVKTQTKKRKRSWFRRLLGKISPFVPGKIGLGLKVALAINDAIFKSSSQFELNPTQAEEDQAEILLKTKVVPSLNLMESNITSLMIGSKPIGIIISELNLYLKQIATMQAWVRMSYQNPQINVVNYMVASITEPLLIALNKLINQGLRANNLSTKLISTPIDFVASDFTNVLQFDLNWQETTSTTYQKLSEKGINNNEEVEIITSIDNPILAEVIDNTVINTTLPQENNNKDDTVKIVIGIGAIAFLFKLLSNYNDE